MRNGLPHYDLHHAIYGSTVATGRFAAPSTDPYLRRGVDDDEEDDGSDDTEALTMGTGPRSGDKRAGSSRGGLETGRKVRLDLRRASRRCVMFTLPTIGKGPLLISRDRQGRIMY